MAPEASSWESEAKQKSLCLKFDKLLEEKQLLKELLIEESESKSVNSDFLNPVRNIVYNSSKKLMSDQEKLVELGLNFAITLKNFLLLEYIAAAEDLCMSLEEYGDDE